MSRDVTPQPSADLLLTVRHFIWLNMKIQSEMKSATQKCTEMVELNKILYKKCQAEGIDLSELIAAVESENGK